MKTLIVSRHKHPHFISIIPFIFLKDFICYLSFNFKLKSQILKKTVNHIIFQMDTKETNFSLHSFLWKYVSAVFFVRKYLFKTLLFIGIVFLFYKI